MEHQDKKLEIWKEAIPRMNEEDLEFILDFPECFEPKVLRMVKKRYEKITKPENGEEEYEEVEETLKDARKRLRTLCLGSCERWIAPMILMRMETFILNTKMKISIL